MRQTSLLKPEKTFALPLRRSAIRLFFGGSRQPILLKFCRTLIGITRLFGELADL
jgi:hypothetical protein